MNIFKRVRSAWPGVVSTIARPGGDYPSRVICGRCAMKVCILAMFAAFSLTVVGAAEPIAPAPMLNLVRMSADGKALEVQHVVCEYRTEAYTRQVPEIIAEEVDG